MVASLCQVLHQEGEPDVLLPSPETDTASFSFQGFLAARRPTKRVQGQWPVEVSSSVGAENCREQIQTLFLPIFWLWRLRPREDRRKRQNSGFTECLLCTGQSSRPGPSALRAAAAPSGNSGHPQGPLELTHKQVTVKQTLLFPSNSRP